MQCSRQKALHRKYLYKRATLQFKAKFKDTSNLRAIGLIDHCHGSSHESIMAPFCDRFPSVNVNSSFGIQQINTNPISPFEPKILAISPFRLKSYYSVII